MLRKKIIQTTSGIGLALVMSMLGSLASPNSTAFAFEPFLGEIRWVGFNFAPRGWEFCNGQLLPISENSALFSLLGTTYGGDGRTTFALPDVRGRVMTHNGASTGPGLSDYPLGSKGGSESVTLNQNQLPSHTHTLAATNTAGDSNTPEGNTLATGDLPLAGNANSKNYHSSASPTVNLQQGSIGNTGGNQPTNIRQPYVTLNCIIATQGLFPSRS